MRFIKLVVEAFQGIGRAEIEFGPGLNVLYGENDLGKSTLAAAVRAALLVLPKSAEADGYVSWYADKPPRVTLTFCDDDQHFWEVTKVFSQSPSAELRHSKDGVTFTLDCKAREVEEKLRKLLGWGIPSPGGKGAPRGLPPSFLSNALLASQTDVDAILEQSLAKDGDASGKLRLQNALATLAQDPLFKRVLDAAQHEHDLYFTETGRRRRTAGSKLMEADEEVKRLQREADALTSQLEESAGIEEHVNTCRAMREDCMGRVADAQATLVLAQTGLANANARAVLEQQLTAAKRGLAEIDADHAKLQELAREIEVLTKKLAALETQVAQAQSQVDEAAAQLRAAEEEAQRASQEQGEQSRQLRKAEFESELARLRERRTQLESQRELTRRAAEALRALDDAKGALAKAQAEKERLGKELKTARDAQQQVVGDVEMSRAMLAFTRWRSMDAQRRSAEEAKGQASEQRALAETKASEANALELGANDELAVIAERTHKLPTAEQLESLERSRRTLDMAEAALGGGLNLLVRARTPVSLGAEVDQRPMEQTQLTGDRSIEAERSARLSIDDLVEIEITAGGAEQRRAVEAARATWKRDGAPLLARAGAADLTGLKEMVATTSRAEQAARKRVDASQKLHAEAQALRGRADLLDQQAERSAPDSGELAARRAALGSVSLEVLEERWTKLKKPNESSAEAEHDRQRELLKKATERVAKIEQDVALSDHVAQTAEQRVQQTSQDAQVAQVGIGHADPAVLSRSIDAELKQSIDRQGAVEKSMKLLETEHSEQRARTQRAVETAQSSLAAKQSARLSAQQSVDTARETLNKKQGEHSAREQQFARLDRSAAAGQVETCAAALAGLPSSPLATTAEVEGATTELGRTERELAAAVQEFFKAEGALSRAGGAQVREQLQQAQDGLKVARAREREIEIDAESWKLLREKLKAAEDSEAVHLGRALGEPVGKRFAELTNHRYSNLQFDPVLSAAGLDAAGVSVDGDVLAALSVGTRDQLATLVRLTIANQLKSSIILDDHLVQTDPVRLAWFREMLLKTALETQVVVLTCRPSDYLRPDEVPETGVACDFAGGTIRAVNLNGVLQRWDGNRKRVGGG